jgi:hypothetical protein
MQAVCAAFERAGSLGRQSAIHEDLPNPAIVE